MNGEWHEDVRLSPLETGFAGVLASAEEAEAAAANTDDEG